MDGKQKRKAADNQQAIKAKINREQKKEYVKMIEQRNKDLEKKLLIWKRSCIRKTESACQSRTN